MKIHEAKKYLPIVKALAEGKTVEYREIDGGIWTNIGVCGDVDWFGYHDTKREFRIKPEPKLRPWRPEEVPHGCFICNYDRDGLTGPWWMIVGIFEYGVSLGHAADQPGYTSLKENYKHSTDGGRTWLPCGVEE